MTNVVIIMNVTFASSWALRWDFRSLAGDFGFKKVILDLRRGFWIQEEDFGLLMARDFY